MTEDERYTDDGLPIVSKSLIESSAEDRSKCFISEGDSDIDRELNRIREENPKLYNYMDSLIYAMARASFTMANIASHSSSSIEREFRYVFAEAYGLLRKQSAANKLEDQMRE